MNILQVSEEGLVFDFNDPLSKVISGMESSKKQEALVFEGKEFKGIILARDIIKKNIPDMERAKISHLSIVRKIKPIEEDTPVEKIIDSMLVNNYKSVPIQDGKAIKILTKFGLLSLISNDAFKGKNASHVMIYPSCVSSGDSISVAKSLLKHNHVYRLVVLNKSGCVEGVIDSIGMLNTLIKKSRASRGEGSGEKIKLDDVPISSHTIMDTEFLRAGQDTELKYIVKMLLDSKKDTVVVEEDGRLLGIITPREILKIIGRDISGVYVQLSGIQDEDSFIKNVVDTEIKHELRKIAKIVPIDYLTLNVKRHKKSEGPTKYSPKNKLRMKYSIRGMLVTHKGAFFSKDYSWDLTSSVRNVLKKLEKEIIKTIGKERDRERFGS